MNTSVLLAFAAYFILLLTIGLVAHKKQTSEAGFIMGNRSLNYWLTALSAHASDMSAWLFMAFPSAIFVGGLCNAWIAIGLMLGMFLCWQFIAKRLRTVTEQTQSYTLSTFFEKRFNDPSGLIRMLTALMTIIFMTFYLSAGMIAMGRLFESVFGIDYYIGLSVAMLVAVIYTFVGGYTTVAWTDAFQAVFLLGVILLVPTIALNALPDGFNTIHKAAEAKNLQLYLCYTPSAFIPILFLVLKWGLGYFGMPHILTKFMGIQDAAELKKSKYVGMTWQILALTASALIGIIGIGYFQGTLADPELIFVEMVKTLFHPFVSGFILCAVIAANMSTMDSQILVCASVLSEDFYKRFAQKKPSSKELLVVSRIGVICVAIVSLLIAFGKSSSVQEAVLYAWTGLGCTFGPLVIMSLYSKRANRYGAVAGILVGSFIAALWPHFGPEEIPAMVVGFSASLLSIYLVSKSTSTS